MRINASFDAIVFPPRCDTASRTLTVVARHFHGPTAAIPRSSHGRFTDVAWSLRVASWTDDSPSAVTQRVRHGGQRSRHATGVSRCPNTGLSLSTLTASGCHGLASPASHHSPR